MTCYSKHHPRKKDTKANGKGKKAWPSQTVDRSVFSTSAARRTNMISTFFFVYKRVWSGLSRSRLNTFIEHYNMTKQKSKDGYVWSSFKKKKKKTQFDRYWKHVDGVAQIVDFEKKPTAKVTVDEELDGDDTSKPLLWKGSSDVVNKGKKMPVFSQCRWSPWISPSAASGTIACVCMASSTIHARIAK